jgi:hypothetical protein
MYIESVLFASGTNDTTYVYYGPGDYYINVGSANITSWSITIQ